MKHDLPVGQVRTFGKYGDMYFINESAKIDENGKMLIEIEIVKGTESEIWFYPREEILDDPIKL